MRLTFYDSPSPITLRASRRTGKELMAEAEAELKKAEDRYEPFRMRFHDPGSEAEKRHKEFETAKDVYEKLRFIFVDHASPDVTLRDRLRRLNAANEEFWRRKS